MGEGNKIRGHQVGVIRPVGKFPNVTDRRFSDEDNSNDMTELMSALPPITDILGLRASKKKGTGTMAGPLNLLT